MCIFVQNYLSPIGNITVKSNADAVTDIFLGKSAKESPNYLTEKAVSELKLYFENNLTSFSFPIELHGTDFQKRVWKKLMEIPYGEVCSYGDIAEKIGDKRYSRAVGGAVNKNPVLIAVPCHRVVGADGALVGFACGLEVKKYLLGVEGANNISK